MVDDDQERRTGPWIGEAEGRRIARFQQGRR
jgi:hypothetical protein